MSAIEGRIPTIGLTLNSTTIITQKLYLSTCSSLNIFMELEILTKNGTQDIRIVDLDRKTHHYDSFVIQNTWYRITVPGTRFNIIDLKVRGESIGHCLNAGLMGKDGYTLWIHGDLSQLFARISECIAQEDLLKFKMLEQKYLFCESWNETVEGDFIPRSVQDFFANGEGPFWYSKEDWMALPYVEYNGTPVPAEISTQEDLTYEDSKFYGNGKCRSLKMDPSLPTIKVDDIKSESLRNTMKQFGFTELAQMQMVTMEPNSVLPIHRDDWTYADCRSILEGPSQLYFVLSGDKDSIKFKFKNVGVIDVSKPIFVNNQRFVHSLVYTGKSRRSVLLAYGKRKV